MQFENISNLANILSSLSSINKDSITYKSIIETIDLVSSLLDSWRMAMNDLEKNIQKMKACREKLVSLCIQAIEKFIDNLDEKLKLIISTENKKRIEFDSIATTYSDKKNNSISNEADRDDFTFDLSKLRSERDSMLRSIENTIMERNKIELIIHSYMEIIQFIKGDTKEDTIKMKTDEIDSLLISESNYYSVSAIKEEMIHITSKIYDIFQFDKEMISLVDNIKEGENIASSVLEYQVSLICSVF